MMPRRFYGVGIILPVINIKSHFRMSALLAALYYGRKRKVALSLLYSLRLISFSMERHRNPAI